MAEGEEGRIDVVFRDLILRKLAVKAAALDYERGRSGASDHSAASRDSEGMTSDRTISYKVNVAIVVEALIIHWRVAFGFDMANEAVA